MNNNSYMNIPFNLSGSRTKGRFKNEMLWGLSKIFDVYFNKKYFIAVFDYVCDIELHYDNEFEFYQIKTSNGQSPYNIKKLTEKKESESNSILGKLFIIKNAAEQEGSTVTIAVVANVPVKFGTKTYNNITEVCLSDLELTEINNLEIILCIELGIKKVTFDGVYYIYSSIDLIHPEDNLLGKTVTFFEKVKGKEPSKPISLYRLFYDTISNCASYELQCTSYDELILNKGISKNQIDNMLHQYDEGTNASVEKCKTFFEKLYENDYLSLFKTKQALNRIVLDLQNSKNLHVIEQNMVEKIIHNIDMFSSAKDKIADNLIINFSNTFPIEYIDLQKWVFIVLVLFKIEDGVYE